MERFRNFDIHFIGLKHGVTRIEYDIDDQFFKLFEKSPIEHGNMHILLDFDKKDSFFMLRFQADGLVKVPCDRCIEAFHYELMFDFEVIVKFDEVDERAKSDDEVLYISRGDSSINIAELLYDYILINIPIQVFHPNKSDGKSSCDPAILERLSGSRNEEKKDDEEVDPRWAALTKLK